MYYYAHWTFATGSLNGSQETLYGLQKSFSHETMCTLFTRHVLDTFISIDFRFKQIISDFFSDSKDCLENGRENRKIESSIVF